MPNVLIEVVVDPRQAVSGSRRVKDELDKVESSADRLRNTVRGALAGIGVGLVLRELGQLSDAYTNAQNRIRTVTDSEQELSDVTAQLFTIANDTRGAFDATVEVYARMAVTARDLGRTQQQTLSFTRSLNEAVALSGATAEQARAGLIQLAQGLATGALRGQDLHSVLEQIPAVADTIAKSLGVTRGQLKQLGEDGKLTSEVIFTAFEKSRQELEDRFGKSVPTVGQSLVVLKNNLIQAVGQFQGTSSAVSELVLISSQAVRVIGVLEREFGNLIDVDVPGFLSSVNVELKKFFDEIDERATPNLTKFGKIGDEILRLQENLKSQTARRQQIIDAGEIVPHGLDVTIANVTARIHELREAQGGLAESSHKAAIEQRNLAIAPALEKLAEEARILRLGNHEREVQAALDQEIARLEKSNNGQKVNTADRALIEDAIRTNQALADRANALQSIVGPTEDFENRLRALDGLLKEGKITQEQFNAAVEALATDTKGVDLSKLNTQGIDLSHLGGGGLQEFVSTLRTAKDDFNALNFDKVTLSLQEENRLLGLNAQERAIQVEVLRQVQALQDAVNGPLAPGQEQAIDALVRQNAQLTVQAQVYDSINGPMQSFLQTQAALNELLASGAISAQQYAIALGNAKQGVDGLGASASEGAAAGLQQIENQLLDVGGAVQTTIVDGFNSAEDALVSFVRTGQVDFSKFVNSLLDDLARLLVQQALLALFTGGASEPLGVISGFANRADGGRVEAGQSYMVGEHNRPERFIPDSAGRIASASQVDRSSSPVVNVTTPAPVVQNIIVRDPDEIPRAIASPEGEDAVLNVIRKNPRAVNQAR